MSVILEKYVIDVELCTKVTIYFFFNDTATTEIYPLSLHDALPISGDLEMDNFRRDMIKLAHIFNRLIMHLKNLVGDLRDANVLRRNISRPKSRNLSYISMAKKQRMKNFPNNINHLFRV